MKKIILSAVVGGLLTLSIAAGTVSVMTVKPATPRLTIVKPFRAMFSIEKDIAEFVKQKTAEGYIVKSIAIIDDETWSKGVVVLEKY